MPIQVVVTVLQCSTINLNWGEGPCLNNATWFSVGCSITHIITDLALICLPMPLIWKIQMRQFRKVTLSSIIGLGGL